MPSSPVLDSQAGFKAEYFDDLFEVEAGSFWFRCRNRLIVWALKKYFGDADSFLEIGCGTGFVLTGISSACPQLKLAGSELFAEGLKYARKRLPAVRLLELDARQLPFQEEFDVVGAFDVIEHIEEDELVLSQLFKSVRGGIVLTVPQHMFLWSAVDEYSCHKRRYSASELKRKVENAGFEVTRITSFVSLLLPALMIKRANKKNVAELDPKEEVAMPRWLDRVLEAILEIERWFIQLGMNMPVGGSLLLVARKPKNNC